MSIDTLTLLIFWVTVATIILPIVAVALEITGVLLTRNLTSPENAPQKELIQHRVKLAIIALALLTATSGIAGFLLNRNLTKLETAQKTEQAKIAKAKEQEYQQKLDAAKSDAETAKSLADKAQEELAITRERNKPRELTKEQEAILLDVLSKGSKNRLFITAAMGDIEAMGYAEKINSLFKQAGWETDQIAAGEFGTFTGIGIKVFKNPSVPTSAQTALKALTAANINYALDIDRQYETGEVQLNIGHRPSLLEKN